MGQICDPRRWGTPTHPLLVPVFIFIWNKGNNETIGLSRQIKWSEANSWCPLDHHTSADLIEFSLFIGIHHIGMSRNRWCEVIASVINWSRRSKRFRSSKCHTNMRSRDSRLSRILIEISDITTGISSKTGVAHYQYDTSWALVGQVEKWRNFQHLYICRRIVWCVQNHRGYIRWVIICLGFINLIKRCGDHLSDPFQIRNVFRCEFADRYIQWCAPKLWEGRLLDKINFSLTFWHVTDLDREDNRRKFSEIYNVVVYRCLIYF